MYEDLKGKIALITGAGKKDGIGYGIAKTLASNGTHIIIADLGEKKYSEKGIAATGSSEEMTLIAEELNSEYGVETMAVNVDVLDRPSVNEMAKQVKERFKRVDILCNNAGAVFGNNYAANYNEEAWIKTIDVNLFGTFRVSQAILPMMFGKPACIINTASRAGKVPPMLNSAYAVAKSGVIMLSKTMAKELGAMNIRVNAICPGQISTGLEKWRFELEAKFTGMTVEQRKEDMVKTIPIGRFGTIDDIGKAVAFLASEESSYITGQAINVCGGQCMEL